MKLEEMVRYWREGAERDRQTARDLLKYDDYKQAFYRKATPDYTEKWTEACEEIYLWIKGQK